MSFKASRRTLLRSAACVLMATSFKRARAADGRTLRFIPQSDLPGFDPVANTSTAIRNHGYLMFDTLYGLDSHYRPQGQMVGAQQVEDSGRLWRLKLRDGLHFHDGSPVTARDAVASVRRWAARDRARYVAQHKR